jgi:hypothetical protein
MTLPTVTGRTSDLSPSTVDTTRIYQEGAIAGALGAVTVALWFLVVDMTHGRPFYTPTVLGTALFSRGVWPATLDTLPPSFEMVLMFSFVHLIVFAVVGGLVAHLLSMAEANPSLGFGIVLLFVILEACFTVAAMIVAEPVLRALTWQAILVANLLAAATMALYFWLRHPRMQMRP